MWAFGITILELFTRVEPFSDCRRVPGFFRKLLGRELPPRPIEEATQFRLTDAWWEICISCWEDDPSSCPPIVHVLEKVKTTVVCTLVITKTV
ncbi:hypothetical protein EDC04DRAFT_2783589 [Pisolithus marmoratus]|nr:hypothetical protein EDC04DRAFT_2783589 [Pisolithus marmoratus]